jgi:hydrogenase expression/formation protein HypC
VCLVAPVRVVRVVDEIAWIAVEGGERAVSLLGVDAVAAGDYILVHAGVALARIEPAEATTILELLADLAEAGAEEAEARPSANAATLQAGGNRAMISNDGQ